MGFIVIEGLDGAGKSTQIKLIERYLESKQVKSKFIHFPRTDSPMWGELISRFLRGELGAIDAVDPYLVALIYGGDRKDAAQQLLAWMNEGYMVIADRYLYSNVAFQCAKCASREQQEKLAHWIKAYEYGYNGIPVPDLNVFLNVPFSFTQKSLAEQRTGTDRDYLAGASDIHEEDLSFQQRVREIYLWQVEANADFERVECSDDQGNMHAPDVISARLIELINQRIFK